MAWILLNFYIIIINNITPPSVPSIYALPPRWSHSLHCILPRNYTCSGHSKSRLNSTTAPSPFIFGPLREIKLWTLLLRRYQLRNACLATLWTHGLHLSLPALASQKDAVISSQFSLPLSSPRQWVPCCPPKSFWGSGNRVFRAFLRWYLRWRRVFKSLVSWRLLSCLWVFLWEVFLWGVSRWHLIIFYQVGVCFWRVCRLRRRRGRICRSCRWNLCSRDLFFFSWYFFACPF